MNKVILIGNLTRDPEAGVTSGGIQFSRFSIAVSRRFANQKGERETDFFNIVAWRGLAENCNTYLRKGLKVCVVGVIQNSTYEKDGVTRYSTDIIADEVEFLTPRSEGGNQESGAGNFNDPLKQVQRKKPSIGNMEPVEDDDLPF